MSENPVGKPRFLSLNNGLLEGVRSGAHKKLRVYSWWRVVALGFVLALTAAACGSSSSGNSTSGSTSASFEPDACPTSVASLPVMANARCGDLVVPENRSIARGPKIRMAVAIIPSVSQPPAADPIVHLAGGPGVDALAQAPTLVAAGLNQNRDLIIMDQRGNFDDEPALTCPEIDQFNAVAVGLPYDSPSTEALHLAATQACHDRLVADGVDLGSYNTPENEADFADLRKVLKIRQWDVYGYSYGTDLALSLMRDYPKGIRSVILDSVVPPSAASLGWTWTNVNEAFNNLFSACAAQSTCSSEYGDLSSLFTSLVQQLEASPVTTTAEPPQGGPPVTVVIDGGTLVNWLVGPQPILKISELPSAIYSLSQNNLAPIATTRAVFTDPEGTGQFGYGLDYGVFCSEWVPYQPESEILCSRSSGFSDVPNLGPVAGASATLYDRGLCHLECSSSASIRAPDHDQQHPDAAY